MIDWKPVQARLGVLADGIAGPRTWAVVFIHMGCRDADRARDLGVGAAAHLNRYEINTVERIASFLGQTAHESGSYRYLREIWGPTTEQKRYERDPASPWPRDANEAALPHFERNRKPFGLGNTQPGDGKRHLGRGILQVTGRSNYRAVGQRIGIDIEANPTLAERPDIAVLTAADWWQHHGCNALADAGNVVALGRLINRGSARATKPANGEAERIALTAKARALLS